MTTIVALGCGLVGEFVVQRLVDDGHSVVAVDLHLPDSIKKNTQIESIEDRQTVIKCPPKPSQLISISAASSINKNS